ncbi:MAG: MiaB/RimO family radical SAM methylthiotransferase [Clostridia bacterium]|nr:MiaB/RimO family radical SAM methylthiotransferase [Clostridia bacterium]
MKAVLFTLGCKVNEVESASIMSALEDMGWEVGDKLEYAEAYVLNTCAVTREAEKKSRQLIARVRKFNPDAKIFVCGCASEKNPQSFEEKGVTFVCGARKKQLVVEEFCRIFGGKAAGFYYPKQVKSRAFIKIQDGCNNFCSYCIIPYLRGREASRTVEDIVEEVKGVQSPEIVLNGINISSYEGGLPRLICALHGVDKRVRLGSLECSAVTDEFLQALKGLKDFAPQFHLSLQSGSDRVLKAMNRHYTRAQYLEKCRAIYRAFHDAAITTDIIAGFATETDGDFAESLSIIKEAGFARVHAFAYSPREGTAAFRLKDIPPDIKSQRLHKLLQAGKEAADKFARKFLGSEQVIIAEEYSDGATCGYTGNYIRVYVKGELCSGRKYRVKLLSLYKDGVLAQINGQE